MIFPAAAAATAAAANSATAATAASSATTRVHAFHSASDNVIAASLALRSYASLLDSGAQLRLHVEPGLGHDQRSDAEFDFFCAALRDWGLLAPPPAPPLS